MKQEIIKLPKQLMNSIRAVIKETGLFKDEEDFISQSIIEQMRKFKR